MDRRTFLKTGAVSGAGLAVPGRALEAVAQPALEELLQGGMIWARSCALVPLTGRNGLTHGEGDKPTGETGDLHAVFYREFELAHAPRAAKIHLFAYTRYRLYVNGRYVGRGPNRFQNQRPEYDTRDLATALIAGRNILCVLVHRDAPTGRIMHHTPGFCAVLTWVDAGGQRRRLVSDESWRAAEERSFGPRAEAWSSIQETIDARRMAAWEQPGFDGSTWEKAIQVSGPEFFPLWPRTIPLLMEQLRRWKQGVLLPRTLGQGERMEFEAEELLQGYHLLEFEAEEGSELEVLYRLPEGAKSGVNRYTARAGKQVYLGGDTFALTSMVVMVLTGRITLTRAEIYEVRYPFERVGRFTCSDPMLNDLWRICARTLEVLSEDAYVDCAERERVEWTDCTPPAFEVTRVMMSGPGGGPGREDRADSTHAWSDARLLKALLIRIAMTQQPDGQLKAHSCSERFDIHAIMEDRSCDWVIALRQYYESTGDKALVRQMAPTMTRLMDWFLKRRTVRGLVQTREWETWDNPLRYQVCEGAGLNAFVYHALCDASYLGREIGRHQEAVSWDAAAADLKRAFNHVLWDEQAGSYAGAFFGPGTSLTTVRNSTGLTSLPQDGLYRPTIQAALFALDSGIVSTERRVRVEQFVVEHTAEAEQAMSQYFLFRTLYEMQSEERDVQVLQIMRRKWSAQVASPWQTTWEGTASGSKVHIYGMVPAYLLSAYVLGVKLDGPMWKKTIVVETRHSGLAHAEGIVVTELGPVPVKWRRGGQGEMTLDVTVPNGARARVRLTLQKAGQTLLVNGASRKVTDLGKSVEVSLESGRFEIVSGRPSS